MPRADNSSGPRQVFFICEYEVKKLFLFQCLEDNERAFCSEGNSNGIDWTYFKKSQDVAEKMKPPKVGREFIQILSRDDFGHSVSFTQEEELEAKRFFEYTNYYRFSIFPRLIKCNENRTFTNVRYLYDMDIIIRERLNYFSGVLEGWIKTTLANILSTNYVSSEYAQAEFYLDLEIYSNKEYGKQTLVSFAETVIKSKEAFIKHHHKEKHGCIPVWVLVEELTFGQIDTFISQLKPEYRNIWIDKVFGKNYRKFVISWIGVARYIRNMSAHYARFYSKRFVVQPAVPREDLKSFAIKNSKKDNLYVMLFTEKKLLSFFPEDKIKLEWNKFITDLSDIIGDSNGLFDFETNGFPKNWEYGLTL